VGFEINAASKRRWQFDNASRFGSFWSGHADQFETGFQFKLCGQVMMCSSSLARAGQQDDARGLSHSTDRKIAAK
jgi:hypothetical protein